MNRLDVINLLKQYKTRYMDEAAFVQRSANYIEQNPDSFYREHLPMHVTCSAWVVNQSRNLVMLMHHKKLNQWFQPGGHADGDENIFKVALKETTEETGIELQHFQLVSEALFDVDIHRIPAMNGEQSHEHIDLRFLIETNDKIAIQGNDESHQVRWVNLYEVVQYNRNRSTFRMLDKTRQIKTRFAA